MTLDTFIINDTTHLIAQKENGIIQFTLKRQGERSWDQFKIEPGQLTLFSDFISNIAQQYTESPYDKILMMVSHITGIPISKIRSRTRKGDVVIARHMVNHFSRKHYTLGGIAGLTGYDHATILNSSKKVYQILDTKYPQLYYDWVIETKNRLYGNT